MDEKFYGWIPILSPELIIREYLFTWSEVPGRDSERLRKYLMDDFGVSWVQNAEIRKLQGGKEISVFVGEKSVAIALNAKKDRVTFKIEKGRTYSFPVELGDDEIRIFKGYKLFRNADKSDFKQVFPDFSEVLLSDNRFDILFDRWFNCKHKVSYEVRALESCDECGEKVLHLSVKISNREGEKLIEGDAWINGSGLAKYKIMYVCPKDSHPERILHKLVRDILHTHVHHSSDLPLPPIKAESEIEAKKKILEEYTFKFMEYKRIASKMRLKEAIEDLSRARGEIVYAKSFHELFRGSLEGSPLVMSFESFDESFNILLEKTSEKSHIAVNYAILGFTSLLVAMGLLQFLYMFPSWLIPIRTLELHLCLLLFPLPLSFFIYCIAEAIFSMSKSK